ncbi:MAG: hypothetical protein B193_3748 [Solidesulfovibrio magneticus str. Maddingley MBC34]|uniref:Lipoprotein n=1 Tax=Solidesulfovibrio magneticus str. Maddingley MBC34 TaxID=1206767 RepID=K6H525_9BACT|nr:MAG: hypothetical protein B193_3748 [Solidesulfovibrio magneticus str. Maddingley MBC34]
MKKVCLLLLLVALAGGCARTTATSLVTGNTAGQSLGLGKTVVLTWCGFEPTDKGGSEKAARLRGLIATHFAGLPGTEVTDAGPLVAALGGRDWRDASDMELAAAARASGVDSVALVEVATLVGRLYLSLPPTWSVETSFAYQARLLDARSGSLVLSALRGRDVTVAFGLSGREVLYKDFAADLAELTQPLAQPTDK